VTTSSFASLNLNPVLMDNLATLSYHEMTPIQAQSLPLILNTQDVIAQGKTGSGKTAAFGLGLLQKLNIRKFKVQALVLCPTRELADQVSKEIRRLARAIPNIKILTLTGGVAFGPQVGSLEHGVHIVVGTPGRIEDHLSRGTLKLRDVQTLVLDEADRMLDMGFQDQIENIIDEIPSERQTLFFSATFPPKIEAISSRIMRKPKMVKVSSQHGDDTIEQHFYKINDSAQRLTAIRLLLSQFKSESTVIFCNMKVETQEVASALKKYGFSSAALNGDLEQKDRDQTLVKFSNKTINVLVATDVAARGLDIEKLDMVINYQLAHDTEQHIHRIGRTGRAGSTGIACTFYSNKDDYRISLLEDYLQKKISSESLPPQSILSNEPNKAPMATLQITGGKKQKVRPGDILGALTGKQGIEGKQVGKITIFDNHAYVAVNRDVANAALDKLSNGKLKGRNFRVRKI
jgi:ATP-independent RNA helicase DbpA